MFITKIIVICKCPSCGISGVHIFQVSFPIFSTTNIFGMIPELTKKDLICRACFSDVEIKRIECEKAESIYGNLGKGEWCCPKHQGARYYPSSLKRMQDKPDHNTTMVDSGYEKIVKDGFPWKCPICKTFLTYRERNYT